MITHHDSWWSSQPLWKRALKLATVVAIGIVGVHFFPSLFGSSTPDVQLAANTLLTISLIR